MRWKSISTGSIAAEDLGQWKRRAVKNIQVDVGLDLVSSQKQAAGCILAVTVGPKRLLKKVPEKEASEPQQ